MQKDRYRNIYKDEIIEIYSIMDDQGEAPLTYWYAVKDNLNRRLIENVDIRELKAFKQHQNGKRPSPFELIYHRAEVIPEIIKQAINNHELQI